MINLSEKSVIELKAIAYDLSMEIQNLNNGLQMVNTEINNRAKGNPVVEPKGDAETVIKPPQK